MKIKMINYGVNVIPHRAHYNDAGLDVFAMGDYILQPHSTTKIKLGFGLYIPDGYVGFIFPRSSLSSGGITCELAPIDSGYRGEIHAIVTNHTDNSFTVNKNTKIGQLVILQCILPDLVEKFDSEERGNGAFGSTDNK